MVSLYIEFEKYKKEYYSTQKKYSELINERERLFSLTQPQATKYDKQMVKGGSSFNKFDDYLIKKEKLKLDSDISEIEIILNQRKKLFEDKKNELLKSNDVYDRIYVLRYINKMKITKVCMAMIYSEAQVYRILKNIKESIGELDGKEKS